MTTLHTELLDAIAWAAQQGWTPATGGNFSARTEAGYWVTASGRDKTRIQADDLLLCDLEGRVLEYVDHLHEHFIDPVVINRGRYQVPEAPGYSIAMHTESQAQHRFPEGAAWQEER